MKFEDFLDELKLNSYERRVYLKLFETGTSTARELCRLSNIPYGRIYDVLSSLERMGLISVIPSEPKTFKMIDPKIALRLLFEKKREEMTDKIKELKSLELPSVKKSMPSNNEIIVLYGKEKFYEMLREFLQTLEREFLGVAEDLAHPEGITYLKERAVKHGKKLKILLAKMTKENEPRVRRYLKVGIEVRLYPLKGLRLLVKDRKEVVQSIVDPKSKERISVYSRNEEYAKSMATFFDSLWERGQKIK